MSKYSEEFKLKIVKEHKETHISAESLQRKYGVHHSQIEQWIKKKLKYYLTKSSIVLGFKKTIIWHKYMAQEALDRYDFSDSNEDLEEDL